MRKGYNTVFFVASHLSNIFDATESNQNTFESESENTVMIREIVVRGMLYILVNKFTRDNIHTSFL